MRSLRNCRRERRKWMYEASSSSSAASDVPVLLFPVLPNNTHCLGIQPCMLSYILLALAHFPCRRNEEYKDNQILNHRNPNVRCSFILHWVEFIDTIPIHIQDEVAGYRSHSHTVGIIARCIIDPGCWSGEGADASSCYLPTRWCSPHVEWRIITIILYNTMREVEFFCT